MDAFESSGNSVVGVERGDTWDSICYMSKERSRARGGCSDKFWSLLLPTARTLSDQGASTRERKKSPGQCP